MGRSLVWTYYEKVSTTQARVGKAIKYLQSRVVEGLYVKVEGLKYWYKKSANKRHGVVFAKHLETNILSRFPNCMSDVFIYSAANYLDPVYKGLHLKAFLHKGYFAKAKGELEVLHAKLTPAAVPDVSDQADNVDVSVEAAPLSPTSKLRRKYRQTNLSSDIFTLPFDNECARYESCDRLNWWKAHVSEFPRFS